MGNEFQALSQKPTVTRSSSSTVNYDPSLTPGSSEVSQRELLYDGIVCVMKIPQTKQKQIPDGPVYEQFGTPVAGGFINFHLYDRAECEMHGKQLRAECKIWKKTMADGREFLYVDLHPTTALPTHERKVWQDGRTVPSDLPQGTLKFECFGQTKGILGFIPR